MSFSDAASKQAIVDAGGVAVVVAAMRQHATDGGAAHGMRRGQRTVQRDACEQAVVDDGGAVVVAAMEQYVADAVLQRYGRGALMNLSCGDAVHAGDRERWGVMAIAGR